MTSEKFSRKDKNQNIQVFVRLRPLNQRERDIKSLGVVEVVNNREVHTKHSQQSSLTKKFTFDRAFGPNAKQVEIYQDVVSPLIEEVLAGYNCTVFAYGQTGTGKTHTMVGENSGDETTWQNDPLAGIIPRALSQLFDELRISNTEYTVRVSYLELYNEELFDLLSSTEDNSKLRIYEDVTRKGSNIVNGLEEITVYNKNEVYKIMAQGQERKRVASTLMNAQSSRSHTVFTIVVHMKENSPEGEELVKIGKLNLVDLAGSENISKAGSDNPAKKERARECVNINQSLLTLGRVITALVERHPHIPYRESKLTRILQESLGGRTKTSIIATVSPGHKDLEETMSTLEYANRAKNIQNKPEVNQKMTKKAILKEYAEEIDRLKRDLQAARDKNGVYLANETYTELTLKQEEQKKEIQELLLKKRAMEEEKEKTESIFSELNQKLEQTDSELSQTKNVLINTKNQLDTTTNILNTTRLHFEEQKHLVAVVSETEHKLSGQAKELISTADTISHHAESLHNNIQKRRTLESNNLQITTAFREISSEQREHINSEVNQFTYRLTQALDALYKDLYDHTKSSSNTHVSNKEKLTRTMKIIEDTLNKIKSDTSSTLSKLESSTLEHRTRISDTVTKCSEELERIFCKLMESVANSVKSADSIDFRGNMAKFVQQWHSGSVERVTSLRHTHAEFDGRIHGHKQIQTNIHHKHRDTKRECAIKREQEIKSCIEEFEQERAASEMRFTTQLSEIETERKETHERLDRWLQEIQRHVENERKSMDDRLEKKIAQIEEERKQLDARIVKHLDWQKQQLEANKADITAAEEDLQENEIASTDCLNIVTDFRKDFDEGTTAICIDMEAFSVNILEVVDHIKDEMLTTLHQAKKDIELDISSIRTSSKETVSGLTSSANTILDDVIANNEKVFGDIIMSIEESTSSTIADMTTITSNTNQLISSSEEHQNSQSSLLDAVKKLSLTFEVELKETTQKQADLENQYLMKEYKVYSPTGQTPVRQEYKYPRNLVMTSPHERILARFRSMLQNSNEEDCIVIESDNENRATSDNESTASEDSAVAFAVPSPPTRGQTPLHDGSHHHPHQIYKSTSETEIFRRQQNGKENIANRSIQHKKPSKLPAPSSHKKPLVERNDIN